jgi:prolyl-tRNA synthetase
MRMTRLFATTLRDIPAEAEVVSHQLLLRAGYIRRVSSGVYNFLPLMWRVLMKIEQIIREEMNAAHAQELLLPVVQPATLWEASGRWATYGKELLRFKDRHDREGCFAPTGEEVITALGGAELKSYRQLPVNLYQIGTKFRDEVRPRFGLLRGREFIMKDAYSFHANTACLEAQYEQMAKTYHQIFERCGLDTKMVRSDSGAIGGDVSHEFMMLTKDDPNGQASGENDVIHCNACSYAANVEKAEGELPISTTTDGKTLGFHDVKIVATKKTTTIEALTTCLQIPSTLIAKHLLYMVNEEIPVLVSIRGDRNVEGTKLKNALHTEARPVYELRLASPEELKARFNTIKGFLGVAHLQEAIRVATPVQQRFNEALQVVLDNGEAIPFLVDRSLCELKAFVIAHNRYDEHTVGFDWQPQIHEWIQTHALPLFAVVAGDACPECGQAVSVSRGIEVGNIFQLGRKYTQPMGYTFTAEDGTEQHATMGCYGIGVTRVAASAVEQHHDDWGIIWPDAIAPYKLIIVIANTNDPTQATLGEALYSTLSRLFPDEVLLDDRDERAGVKFKDADLMGFPLRITVGKFASEGKVEVKRRGEKDAQQVIVESLADALKTFGF